jgi:hypothetical protein
MLWELGPNPFAICYFEINLFLCIFTCIYEQKNMIKPCDLINQFNKNYFIQTEHTQTYENSSSLKIIYHLNSS